MINFNGTNRIDQLPLTRSRIRTLKKHAANKSLEVKHLLKLAVDGDPAAVPLLRQMKIENGWNKVAWSDESCVIPSGPWVDAICCYLERGYRGLIDDARDNRDATDFCLGVLEGLSTPESVAAMMEIGGELIAHPSYDRRTAVRLADAINQILSFKDAPPIDEYQRIRLRDFLHHLLSLELTIEEKTSCICALRGVGDEESLELLKSLEHMPRGWEFVVRSVFRAIRKRVSKELRR